MKSNIVDNITFNPVFSFGHAMFDFYNLNSSGSHHFQNVARLWIFAVQGLTPATQKIHNFDN